MAMAISLWTKTLLQRIVSPFHQVVAPGFSRTVVGLGLSSVDESPLFLVRVSFLEMRFQVAEIYTSWQISHDINVV